MTKVGLVGVNITPYIGCPLAGYAAREGVSQGIHDELYAKVILIESRNGPIVLVAADLVNILGELI